MQSAKEFAPEYSRNEDGLILFPRDSQYRKELFPLLNLDDHPAKANLFLVQALIEYVSEPDETIMDIMAGTGTIMVAALVGRKVVCIDIEEEYADILEQNAKSLEAIAPGIEEVITVIHGDCMKLLPLPIADHVIFSPPYCLAPGTKVLKANLTWAPIETMCKGDELIGIDEESPSKGRGKGRKMRKAVVEDISETSADAYIISLSNGETVIASADHSWLKLHKYGYYGNPCWATTEELSPGDKLKYLCKPWEQDSSYDGGYLSGVYDGEGWVDNDNIGFRQNLGTVMSRVENLIIIRGYHPAYWSDKEQKAKGMYITRKDECMRFLGSIRPRRLLEKSDNLWDGREIRSKVIGSFEVEVASVIPLPIGKIRMVHLQTSTGTFIAEGLVSHNSNIMKKGQLLDRFSRETLGEGLLKYSKHPDNIGNLNEFLYHQKMERIYKKVLEGLPPGGTLSIIIKDHIEAGERIYLGLRAQRDCVRAGFEEVGQWKWLPPGSAYIGFMRARGDLVVDDEDIIVLRKPR